MIGAARLNQNSEVAGSKTKTIQMKNAELRGTEESLKILGEILRHCKQHLSCYTSSDPWLT